MQIIPNHYILYFCSQNRLDIVIKNLIYLNYVFLSPSLYHKRYIIFYKNLIKF